MQTSQEIGDRKGSLTTKMEALKSALREMERVVVAFSGGADSTLLLRVARETLGDGVLAVTAASEITSRLEQEDAVRLARLLGAAHLQVETDDLSDPAFTANPTNKCYLCKKRRFARLQDLARAKNFRVVVDGANVDDLRDFRPGLQASRELGVRSPLSEAGLRKDEIRRLSKDLGLPTWNKPAAACLASRIPYHQPITAEKLKQIDEGEAFLRRMNLSVQVRVRHHGSLARLEISAEDIAAFLEKDVRNRVAAYFKELGFQFVTLDLEGYAMGSLNREIQPKGQ